MRSTVVGFLLLVSSYTILAQENYRTFASGNWSDPGVWQRETPNGSSIWVAAITPPDFSDEKITIRNGHSVTVSSDITIDQVSLYAGGSMTVQDGIVVTINNGVGVDFFQYNGSTLHLLGESNLAGGGYFYSAGQLNVYSVNSTGAITSGVAATGNVRTSTRYWGSNATIQYVGLGKQYIGNGHPNTIGVTTVINNPNGVEINNTSTSSVTFNGDVLITDGELLIDNDNVTMGSGADFTVNGGSLHFRSSVGARFHNIQSMNLVTGTVLMSSVVSNFPVTLIVNGNLNLQGGTFVMNSGVPYLILTLNGDVAGSALIECSGGSNNINIFGSNNITHAFPFSQNSSIRTLTVNRSGLILQVPYSLNIRNISLESGTIDFNSDQILIGSLNMASGTVVDLSDVNLDLRSAINNTLSGGLFTSSNSSSLIVGGTTIANSTIAFSGGSSLQSLTINRPGAVTLSNPLIITDELNLTRSSFTNTGGINFSSGALINRNSTCLFSGLVPTGGPYSINYTGTSLTTSIEAQGSLSNVTSALSGTLTLSNPLTLAGNLTVSSGTLVTGVNAISTGSLLNNGTFNEPSNSTLTLTGNFTNNGTYNVNEGTVVFDGSGAQSIGGTSTVTFNNITLSNNASVSVESDFSLRGVLALGTNATFDADGSSDNAVFTLLSVGDAAGSDASIATLPSGATVTGDVSVQRYWGIEDNDFRYISSPVTNGTLQQLLDAGVFVNGYPGSDFPCGGLCDNDEANISWYDEAFTGPFQNGYIDFPGPSGDASETFVPGRGYGLYMWDGTAPTLWTSRGTVNQGDIPLTVSNTVSAPAVPSADGWNLVGNPYPSSIIWEDNTDLPGGWTMSGSIDPTIWIYDEVAEMWRSYNAATNTGNNFNGTIATGQAFWVEVNGNGPHTLEVHEAAKTSNSGAYYRKHNVTIPTLALTLSHDGVTDNAFILEEPNIHSRKMSTGVERMSLAFVSEEAERIAYYGLNNAEIDIPVSVQVREAGEYSLKLSSSLNGDFYLVDKWLNTVTPASKDYTFIIETNATALNDRFVVTRNAGVNSFTSEEVVISVYPNPVERELTVELRAENVAGIYLLNSVGQVVETGNVLYEAGISKGRFDMSTMPAGVYFVRVVKSDRSVYIKKVIKREGLQ